MSLRDALLASLCALLLTPASKAADQQQLRARLEAAASLSSLDDANLRQWYWKIDATLYDSDGKNPRPATLEMWFHNGDLRSTATVDANHVTTLRKGDILYTTGSDLSPMLALSLIQMQALHPITAEVFQPTVSVNLNRQDRGSLHLDCIAPMLVKPTNATVSVGTPFSFCFLRDTPDLVATLGAGGRSLLRTRIGTFQSHQIPMELDIVSGQQKVAEARTISLVVQSDDPSLFTVTPEMTPFTGRVTQQQSQVGVLLMSGNPPAYPAQAKQTHLTGTVVFNAVIGKDGRLSSLQPTGNFPPVLMNAARDAVTTWLYRPLQLSGVPVEVETQITVHFDMN